MTKALLAVILLALSACTTTRQLDHWQAEDFSRDDLDNVLVVAVTSNTTYRFLFEAELERRVQEHGRNATTSLKALGDEFPTKEAVEAYIKSNNIDYVIATRVADGQEEKDYVPESVRTYYTGPYYPTYGAYYGAYPGNTITMVREAYVDTRTTVILVTTIFDARTEQPVFVGHSSTFEPGSVANLASDIARSTWSNLRR